MKKPHVSIAPMLDWTDRHCRFFHRLISPHAILFTEMVTTGAIIHGNKDRHLAFSQQEHPVVLQLGGSDPATLATCAKIATEDYGYDEVNLNCGCPSDRVQNGVFGACLMNEPDKVARCIEAMNKSISVPVTVKCRIGIDDCEERPFLDRFIQTVMNAGCGEFTIHARKAWLKGLSPKENREVPPLRYDIAAEIKQKYPQLKIILNGGLCSIGQIQEQLQIFDGVMIGREAYQNPWILAEIECRIFEDNRNVSRYDIIERLIPYMEEQMASGVPLKSMARHILGLFHEQRGGKKWRQVISQESHLEGMRPDDLLNRAAAATQQDWKLAA
ncbi:MAG: tRNA dihydrouridine(20/20a) synthase DusA [Micavibrio aeruginosavorus]|uniref:tRNA-dihydrouridine(20/20a) synthase n=1 Tax=Micavibrio aeruginosavorus TaxID=349221 RepID=A0A7T5R0Z7_9BACT|nr:MAG: tRNA dihydrouridine(20/20a) synthase DusA [Micavibrio aeruginosavorus]